MNLPCEFDCIKIFNIYLKIRDDTNHIQTIKNIAIPALNRIKNLFNINELNEEILSNIDKKFIEWHNNKLRLDDSISIMTEKNNIFMFRKVISKVTGYIFKSSFYKQKDNNDMPLKLLNMCNSEPIIDNITKIFINHINKNKKSNKTKRNIIVRLHLVIEELKDVLIENKITRELLINSIQNIENTTVEKIKTKDNSMEQDTLNNLTKHIIRIVNEFIECYPISSFKNILPIKVNEIKARDKIIERIEKDYFNDEELEKISSAYQNDRERLIFTFFLTTGVRIGGLLNLKINSVYEDNLEVKKDGSTLEKGNKTRRFTIFLPLKQALEKYRDGEYGVALGKKECALFPIYNRREKNYSGNVHAIGAEAINKLIKNVCTRAGVNGTYVHSHAFRKTVVIKLMNEGNSLEHVAKFIGHSTPCVTAKSYWVPTQEDLIKNMHMSWIIDANCNVSDSTSHSSYATTHLQRITCMIMEGMKAKERLQHAIDIMTTEQLYEMEKKWTDESSNNVTTNTKDAIKDILNSSSTISEISSYISN